MAPTPAEDTEDGVPLSFSASIKKKKLVAKSRGNGGLAGLRQNLNTVEEKLDENSFNHGKRSLTRLGTVELTLYYSPIAGLSVDLHKADLVFSQHDQSSYGQVFLINDVYDRKWNSDQKVTVEAGHERTAVHKTTGSLNPEFNEQFKFKLDPATLAKKSLVVSVWEKHSFARDEYLAGVTIPLHSLERFNYLGKMVHLDMQAQEGDGYPFRLSSSDLLHYFGGRASVWRTVKMSTKDLSFIDKLLKTVEMDELGVVDVEKMKAEVAGSGDEREKVVLEVLEEVGQDRAVVWTDFLGLLKVGLGHLRKLEVGDSVEEMRAQLERMATGGQQGDQQVTNPLSRVQRLKLLHMFNRMDLDGDGYVDEREFQAYMMAAHRGMIGKKTVGELYQVVVNSDTMDSAEAEARGITFMDMVMYVRKNGDLELPVEAEDQMDGSNGVGPQAIMQSKRWKPFETFKREDSLTQAPLLTSDEGIIKDFLPGIYFFSKIINYSDLPPLKPASTLVAGVKWQVGPDGKSFPKLQFPPGFSGEIASEIATTETLDYYGARMAESSFRESVELKTRHCLDDFTYAPDYLSRWVERSAGGAALEYHEEFAHLDCPLESIANSGHYVLAKFTDDENTELEITAFKVPSRHTVFTPAGVIHTNNYLRGTWRTMLSDSPVCEAKLEKSGQPFTFNMAPLL